RARRGRGARRRQRARRARRAAPRRSSVQSGTGDRPDVRGAARGRGARRPSRCRDARGVRRRRARGPARVRRRHVGVVAELGPGRTRRVRPDRGLPRRLRRGRGGHRRARRARRTPFCAYGGRTKEVRTMRRIVMTCAVALTLAFASPALADPVTTSSALVPTSSFGGSYLMTSADGRLVAFQTADGRVRWELDGLPWSDWGVNDAVRAATVGFDDASVLVL